MNEYLGRVRGRGYKWGLGSLTVAVALAVLATASVAAQTAPAPEDLRLVVDGQGFIERLQWDPPADTADPARYDVNYRFASEDPNTAQVFWTTRNTHLTAAESFGSFVECEPGHHPSDEWIVWITYPTPAGPSQASNQVSMCFP